MKNKTIAFLLSVLIMCGFAYCVISFVELDFNFWHWSISARSALALWCVVVVIFDFFAILK